MNQQGERWTADQVLALAPDEASRKTGSRLGASGPWSEAGSGSGAVWGLCKGSGSTPYKTVVATNGNPAYKCTCPSRKFPCKHALGLLLLWATDETAVRDEKEAPDWANAWLEMHRKKSNNEPTTTTKTADPEAARRRAEQRAERITMGASELEQRLTDLLRGGLAAAEQTGYGLWEETARRMVDAQAPGLAARVRDLGAVPASGPGWPARLLEECALLHLLDSAWLARDRLPEPLATTVRTRVGLTAPAEGPPVRDRWLVLAQYDTPDGKLTTRRSWLYGTKTGRTALVLSYGAGGRAPEVTLPTGLMLDTELTFYPGAGRLRADIGERPPLTHPIDAPPPGVSPAQAVQAYGSALRDDPWLDACPVTLSHVVPIPTTWQLADPRTDLALPIAPAARSRPGLWKLVALSGGAPVTVFGECGHQGFTPLTAWSETSPEPLPLTAP